MWGRQWCVDKGFGLGAYRDLRWGHTNTPELAGARILRLNSGDYPIAEIVDSNRDNRADQMVVALRLW